MKGWIFMFKGLYLFIFKKAIIKAARQQGCDGDGDIVNYRGKHYYVHVFHNVVKRIPRD